MRGTPHHTILLVEDEALIAMQEARALEKYGYQVITVPTGEQAIETMENTPAIDLILMDIDLGHGLDGTETAEIILQTHDVPILFLSSHTEPEIVHKTEEITSYGYVVKHSGITILDASIKMAVKLFRAHQQLKQKEQQLRESEEKYRFLYNTMAQGVVLQNAEGKIIEANPAACRILGLTMDQMTGKTAYDPRWKLIKEDGTLYDPAHMPSNIALHTGKPALDVCCGIYIPEDETYRWILISSIPRFTENASTPSLTMTVFTDITERKRAEDTVRTSEEKYRRLFENMNDEVHLWKVIRDEHGTIHNWRLADVNPAGLRAWKKTRTETIGKTTDNIWPDGNPIGLFMPIVKKIFEEGRPYTWESYFEGTHQVLKMTSVAFGEYFYSTGMDVTEYKRVEAALRESEEKYRFLYDTMAHGVVLQDAEGKIVEANPAACRTLGLTMDQMMGKTAYDPRWKMIQEDGTSYDPAHMPSNIALKTGKPALDVCCGIYIPEDETYRWILISSTPRFKENDSKPYLTMTVFTDITKRKRAEDELMKHQIMLKKAEEISNQGAWEWDIIKNRWTFSDNWLKIHGCQVSSITQEELLAMAYPEDAPRIEQSFQDALKGIHHYGLEHRIIRQNDHEVRWVTAAGETICDASGNPIKMYGTAQDITERKQAEEELKTAIKDKQSLLQEILHRTKNNMAAIISLLQLRAHSIDDARVLQIFADLENRIRSMLLVQHKLYQSNDFAHLDLAEYLHELAYTIFSNLHVGTSKTSLTFDLQPVTVSPNTAIPCGLLVNELITNALKYAFPGERTGTVTIGLHGTERGDIELRVCDNGVGLPEDFDIRTVDSLGSQLVISFVNQLHGTLDMNREHGTAWLIRFRQREECSRMQRD